RATSDGDSSDQVMVQFDDGTDDNRINFYREAGNMTLYAKSGGSFEANGAVVGSNPNNTSFVCAVSWEQDNALTSYDGVTGQSDTDFDLPIGLNNILLNDSYFGGTGNFTIAQIDYYPFTHSQAALNALTGEVPTIVNNSLTITQGETVVLDGNDLSATDPDSDDTSLTFTVSSVTNGQFENTASAGVAITSWLQSDVTAGNIQFVHDGSANAPAYDVVVDDGELNSGAVAAASVTFTLATVTPPSLLGSSIHGLQEVEDLTVSYTVAAGGSDTVLIVVTHGTDNANEGREVVDSVTFNGANLSKAVAHINNGVDEVETGIWYLTDPPTITADVVINGSETPNMRAYTVCVLQDASQSGPEATAAATGAHDDSPYELGITTLSDDAIIVSALNMHTNRTFAPNSGQTIVQTSGGTNIGYGTGYKVRASAGTETDSYTATKDENTAHVAAAWGPSGNPSGGGGGNPATPLVDGATPLIDGATPVIG
ncbi:MAG: cadherin-like domain-containing protein, partial [Pseudomonadota bacterium]